MTFSIVASEPECSQAVGGMYQQIFLGLSDFAPHLFYLVLWYFNVDFYQNFMGKSQETKHRTYS